MDFLAYSYLGPCITASKMEVMPRKYMHSCTNSFFRIAKEYVMDMHYVNN